MPELLNNSEQTIIEENSESSRVDLESKDESMPNKTIKGYQFTKDYSVRVKCVIPLPGTKHRLALDFNPIVTLLSIGFIWVFIAWCCINKENVPFPEWRLFLSKYFTWFYVGGMNVFLLFIFGLLFSKYSDIKLGNEDDVPEYNNFSWFMMLFSCGIGVGLFFYGVAEPIFHYTNRNRYSVDPTLPDNKLAQISINLPMLHWGIHGWAIFSLVGLLLSIMSYREKLPLTMKSCFYPLIGDGIFGWMGDFVDVFSIMATLFGVCTSLGIGAKQVAKGLSIISPSIDPENVSLQVILIWCITFVATVSTVSGIGMGIRRLSEISFGMGMFIMVSVFCLDRAEYLLNLLVQSLGFYFQHFLQLGWHTDAFEQLGNSHGREDRNRYVPKEFSEPDGPSDWIHSWTLFYWGWWISFTPFCAIFLAKISRGRTVREFILGTIMAPSLYCFIWIIFYGGVALRLERESSEIGLCCKEDSGWFRHFDDLSIYIDQNSMQDNVVDISNSNWMCSSTCGPCATSIIEERRKYNQTYGNFLEEYRVLGNDFGSTTKDRSLSRLSCHPIEQMWFDVVRSYKGVGEFLSAFSLFSIILYFVTSSDSGSLVIDCLSANGIPEPPPVQRVFWALMEGATASALLVAGGKDSLTAIKTIGIVSAFPYAFIVIMVCIALWRALNVAKGSSNPIGPSFQCGLIDPLVGQPFKRMKFYQSMKLFAKFLFNVPFASYTMAKVSNKIYNPYGGHYKFCLYSITFFALFLISIVLFCLEFVFSNVWVIGLFSYLCFCTCLTTLRKATRHHLKIEGSVIEDFVVSILLYPCVAVQLEETIDTLMLEESSSETEEDRSLC